MKKAILYSFVIWAIISLDHLSEAANWKLISEAPLKGNIDTDSISGGSIEPKEAWFAFEYTDRNCDPGNKWQEIGNERREKCLATMYVYERFYLDRWSCRLAFEMHMTDGSVYTSKHHCALGRVWPRTDNEKQWKAIFSYSGVTIPEENLSPNDRKSPSNSIYQCHLVFENGSVYDGDCINGRATGKGVLVYKNGTRYDGDFVNDSPHGKGIIVFGPATKWAGERYEGEIVNVAMSGNGVYLWGNGKRYEGEFSDNTFHGYGTLFNPDGSILQQGKWINGKYVGAR